MVANRQLSMSRQEEQWLEHIDGEPQYGPPVPPLAPAKLTGSVYIAGLSQEPPECDAFATSLQDSTGSFVQTVTPDGAGSTSGMLGYMFWASGAAIGARHQYVSRQTHAQPASARAPPHTRSRSQCRLCGIAETEDQPAAAVIRLTTSAI